MICEDTSQVGGPNALFDHQMCIDVAEKTIYVFGGRILTPRNIDDLSNDPQYSGLYSYHIGINMWTQIFVDCNHPSASNPDVFSIKSRATHSMLFHHVSIICFFTDNDTWGGDLTSNIDFEMKIDKGRSFLLNLYDT